MNTDRSDRRQAFIEELATKVGCNPTLLAPLDQGICQLADAADEEARRAQRAADQAGSPPPASDPLAEAPEQVRNAAQQFLCNPEMITELINDLGHLGVVGEPILGVSIYLIATSRHLPRPQSAIVQSPSASGKSYVMEKVLTLMPDEELIAATDLTPNALYYMEPGALRRKIIYACERKHANPRDPDALNATIALREMVSSGRLDKLVPMKGPNNQLRTERISQEGPIVFLQTTTQEEIFDEDQNRLISLTTDESPEQTARILALQAAEAEGETSNDDVQEFIRQKHKLAQRLLSPVRVQIPYARYLQFDNTRVTARRAFRQLLGLIEAVALVRQCQKQIVNGVIHADIYDYQAAFAIMAPVLARTFTSIKPQSLALLDVIRGHFGLSAGAQPMAHGSLPFTRKQCASWAGVGMTSIRARLDELADAGLVEQDGEGRGKTHFYRLVGGVYSSNSNVRFLIDPAELQRRIAAGHANSPNGATSLTPGPPTACSPSP